MDFIVTIELIMFLIIIFLYLRYRYLTKILYLIKLEKNIIEQKHDILYKINELEKKYRYNLIRLDDNLKEREIYLNNQYPQFPDYGKIEINYNDMYYDKEYNLLMKEVGKLHNKNNEIDKKLDEYYKLYKKII